MGRRHQLINSVIHIIDHNRDGSYRTRHDRQTALISMMKELYGLGYQLNHIRYFKTKHVWKLVEHWQEKCISVGSIKNRLCHIRWLAGKVNKANIVPSNEQLKIAKRCYVSNTNKSRQLTTEELSRITEPRMRLSLRAQVLFGLRVEESLKIQPHLADQGDKLYIKNSWAKGGRNRYIPITTKEQRQWLDEAKALVKYQKYSLIPHDTNYKTYHGRFKKCCQRAGIYHLHGHRHYYAQQRFKALAGYECPANGGPTKKDLSPQELIRDREIRLAVSLELGHGRYFVTKVYCG